MFQPIEQLLLFIALPAVLACALLEGLLLRSEAYDWKAFGVSVFDLFARTAVQIALPLGIAAPLVYLAHHFRLATLTLDGWPVILLLFITLEFFYYWMHRAMHRVRWFWCNHAVHHSPNQLTLAAAFRIGMFGKLSGTVLFMVPLVWIGFDARTVLQCLSLNLLYQFWIHATWIPKLGWLEYFLNTPSAHRVHHASNLEYLDANYGGVLIVFDRLFGTYIEEKDEIPCRYGLIHPLSTYNPLKVELDQWIKLAKDLAATRSLRAFIGTLCMPPGWKAEGPGETVEELRAAAGLAARPRS